MSHYKNFILKFIVNYRKLKSFLNEKLIEWPKKKLTKKYLKIKTIFEEINCEK